MADDPKSASLTIVLQGSDGEKDHVDIRAESESDEDGNVKLTVHLPRLIDVDQANQTADLLFEEIDKQHATVEEVEIKSLRFTAQGETSFNMFLAIHAASVKSVVINDILGDSVSEEDELAFSSLALAFQASKLEKLDLSQNVLGAYIWKSWSSHTGLQQLILDEVEMDDDSLKELESHFTFANSLEDMHVALTNPPGTMGIMAANSILQKCTKLCSLTWVNHEANTNTTLPWFGLKDMAHAMFKSTGRCLLHLIMDGSSELTSEELDALCSAIGDMPRLKTLRLHEDGLTDSDVQRLVGAMRHSRPPIKAIDFSNNRIGSDGAKSILELLKVQKVAKNLRTLILDDNEIDADGARDVLQSFARQTASQGPFSVSLESNEFDYAAVALALALQQKDVSGDRERLTKDHDRLQAERDDARATVRSLMAGQTSMIADIHTLQKQVSKLKKEKEALVQALGVLGAVQYAEDYRQMQERMAALEQAVMGRSRGRHVTRNNSVESMGNNSFSSMDSSTPSSPLVNPRNMLIKTTSERWGSLLKSKSPVKRTNSVRYPEK